MCNSRWEMVQHMLPDNELIISPDVFHALTVSERSRTVYDSVADTSCSAERTSGCTLGKPEREIVEASAHQTYWEMHCGARWCQGAQLR